MQNDFISILLERYTKERSEKIEQLLKNAFIVWNVSKNEIFKRVSCSVQNNSTITIYKIDHIPIFEVSDISKETTLKTIFTIYDKRLISVSLNQY